MPEPVRWSGFATQSKAWQAGYEWAYHRGKYSHLNAFDAPEREGYAFDTPKGNQWQLGAEYAQAEQTGRT